MMNETELHRALLAAHGEALRVGDSPLRADLLAGKLEDVRRGANTAGLAVDARNRVLDALNTAERVLRRDDDGREAARHLQIALGALKAPPRKPSPFLDDNPE